MRLFHWPHEVELFKNWAPGEQLQPREAAIMLHSGSSAANVGKKSRRSLSASSPHLWHLQCLWHTAGSSKGSYIDVFLAFPESRRRCGSLLSGCRSPGFLLPSSLTCWDACLSRVTRTCCWSPAPRPGGRPWIWTHRCLVCTFTTQKQISETVGSRVFHWCGCPTCYPPFTCVAFTKLIVLPKETVSVVAGDFFSGFDVPQHLHTRCISSRWHKLHDKKKFTCSSSAHNRNWDVYLSLKLTLQFGRQSGSK